MTGSAQSRRVDAIVGNTGTYELFARRGDAVEEPVIRAPDARQRRHRWIDDRRLRLVEEPARDLGIGESVRTECLAYIRADFVAAGANRRPDGGHEIGWLDAVLPRERRNRNARNPRGQTTPARMRGAHGTAPRIRQEQRHAVGSLYGEGHRRIGGQVNVCLRPWRRRPGNGHDNCGAVHLMQTREVPRIDRDAGRRFGPSLVTVVRIPGSKPPRTRRK